MMRTTSEKTTLAITAKRAHPVIEDPPVWIEKKTRAELHVQAGETRGTRSALVVPFPLPCYLPQTPKPRTHNTEEDILKATQSAEIVLINAIEYLVDENGVIEARGKEVKLRLLDTVKAQDEEVKWQLINIVLPIAFLILFGLAYNFLRRRRFAR